FLESRPDIFSMRINSRIKRMGGPNHRPFTKRDTWCETDEGRFYVTVWAGAKNRVWFGLDKSLWGTHGYLVTDTFIDSSWELHQVTLQLADDFAERIEKISKPLPHKVTRPVVDSSDNPAKSSRPEFSPETAPIKSGYGRIIATLIGPEGLIPAEEVTYGKHGFTTISTLSYASGLWYRDMPVEYPHRIRAQGYDYASDWQDLSVLDGQITYVTITATPTIVDIDSSNLSPTLNAAALVLELQLNRSTPVEEENDRPHPRYQTDDSGWDQAPMLMSFIRRYQFKKTNGINRLSQYFNPTEPFSEIAFSRFGYRAVLRTAARQKPLQGSASSHPSGRKYFDPITLKSPWKYLKGDGQTLLKKLQDGDVKPAIDGVLAFRAVGESDEGLPWVQGVLMPLEQEELALAVKARMQSTADDSVPNLDNVAKKDYANKMTDLEQAKESTQAEKLKALIGEDNYKLFENDKQRQWFANNGSWYNSQMKVFSDDHGYILTRQHKLADGSDYVLYLWSNSRDQMKPDTRIVFKAGKDNTDLGVIRLPSYQ
ncbi:MAG: hypothetical protein V3V10_00630, partial [Planctomycetota bacterium]